MIKGDYEYFKGIQNPSQDDYLDLLKFTNRLIRILRRERKQKAAANKKNRILSAKAANRMKEVNDNA
ncbi:MAG: hypothetical protein PQJ58_15120 [Spirochaetales bacterium]|nr:hypothetical protein [Spirochaetales bacterium]